MSVANVGELKGSGSSVRVLFAATRNSFERDALRLRLTLHSFLRFIRIRSRRRSTQTVAKSRVDGGDQ
jgi:hypothetical protein